jgi:hypothetical protein
MSTKTQKNFKKQMREIQKDLSDKNQEEYYSYIEKTHIKNYYSINRKRKFITVSLASLLTILYFGYSLYTYLTPVIRYRSSQAVPAISRAVRDEPYSSGVTSAKYTKIVTYLDKITSYDRVIMPYLNITINEFNNTLNKKLDKTVFIQNSSSRIKQLENTNLLMADIKIPEEFKDFHMTVMNKFNTLLTEITFCTEAISNYNLSSSNTIRTLSEKADRLAREQREKLLKAFDSTGIKYEIEKDSIRYYYQK